MWSATSLRLSRIGWPLGMPERPAQTVFSKPGFFTFCRPARWRPRVGLEVDEEASHLLILRPADDRRDRRIEGVVVEHAAVDEEGIGSVVVLLVRLLKLVVAEEAAHHPVEWCRSDRPRRRRTMGRDLGDRRHRFPRFSGGKTPGIDEEARAANARAGVHSGQKKSISPGGRGVLGSHPRLTPG